MFVVILFWNVLLPFVKEKKNTIQEILLDFAHVNWLRGINFACRIRSPDEQLVGFHMKSSTVQSGEWFFSALVNAGPSFTFCPQCVSEFDHLTWTIVCELRASCSSPTLNTRRDQNKRPLKEAERRLHQESMRVSRKKKKPDASLMKTFDKAAWEGEGEGNSTWLRGCVHIVGDYRVRRAIIFVCVSGCCLIFGSVTIGAGGQTKKEF